MQKIVFYIFYIISSSMWYVIGAIVLVLLILLYFWPSGSCADMRISNSEKLIAGPPGPGTEPALSGKSYVKLYESFGQDDLGFEFAPDIDYIMKSGQGFYRGQVKMNLKSIDINLPNTGIDTYDQIRKVELWSVYPDMVTQSTQSDFYNSYLEPAYSLTGNPAHYRKICRVLPGERLKIDMVEPIKKVFVIANL
jgi:hypothetical protein